MARTDQVMIEFIIVWHKRPTYIHAQVQKIRKSIPRSETCNHKFEACSNVGCGQAQMSLGACSHNPSNIE